MISRAAAEPKPTAGPTLIAFCNFQLVDQTEAEGSLHRWRLQDFDVAGEQLSDRWFMTVAVKLAGELHHLHQHDYTFFTAQAGLGVTSQAQSAVKLPTPARPAWRKRSDRWGAVKDGKPLQFIGQFVAAGYAVYLFSDASQPPLLAAFVREIGEQDADAHCDQEAKRRA